MLATWVKTFYSIVCLDFFPWSGGIFDTFDWPFVSHPGEFDQKILKFVKSPHGVYIDRCIMRPRRAWKPGKQALLTLQCYVSRTLRHSILRKRMLGFLGQQFEFRFCSVAICKCCQFSTSLLGSRTWEFWMELTKKKTNSRRLLNYNKGEASNFLLWDFRNEILQLPHA